MRVYSGHSYPFHPRRIGDEGEDGIEFMNAVLSNFLAKSYTRHHRNHDELMFYTFSTIVMEHGAMVSIEECRCDKCCIQYLDKPTLTAVKNVGR